MNRGMSADPTKGERRGRLALLERERVRRERRWALLVWGSVGGAMLLIVGSISFALWRQANAPVPAAPEGVQSYEVEPDHVVKPVTYEQAPPVGGPHNPIWLNCGVYEDSVPNENAVHSLEHGAVWLTYNPDLSASDVDTLKEKLPSDYVILSPYPGLKDPVVASAWGKQLRATGVDDPRLGAFISEYVQGSQAPEPGASCSGGSDGTLPLDSSESG